MSPLTKKIKTVRRSVALPRNLLTEAQACARPELKSNVNRLVTIALMEFVENRKRFQFEEAMAQMAADPQIKQEIRQINKDFIASELDGLANFD